ncbi:hypothetical protein GCM10010116_33500 [Microbispora rosea subsp. aerata]|nr:hypothetical protein GCM10010116_33500 [Microbispora rosea subsp. aerata]GIH56038.1 hypothetical protein Mro02_29520 [Microbispora rosea subsp. aerata]GLJ86639.1 hypothetical protein GCM10017588_53770 [Microbispora rosea subsp. aerata]
MTVVVAAFIASAYLAGLLSEATGLGGPLAAQASLAEHFEILGYAIVGAFAAVWTLAALLWRLSGLGRRYGE